MDFPKDLKIAQAMESADRDAQHLQALLIEKAAPVTEAAVHNRVGTIVQTDGVEIAIKTVTGVVVGIGFQCVGTEKQCVTYVAILPEYAKSKRKEQNSSQPNTNTAKEGEDDEVHVYTMFPLRSKKYDPIYATVSVDGKPIRMEINTGATLSVISEMTYNQVWKDQAPLLSAQDRVCKITHLYGARNSSQGIT